MRRADFWRYAFDDYRRIAGIRGGGLSRRPPAGYEIGRLRPVVLVPGVYETWHWMRAIADHLHALGHPVHVVPAMGVNRASIPVQGRIVAAEIARLDLRGVALVAHSKGGLIGKHVMAFDDAESRVDRLVAVASPFGGSDLARYMLNPALRAFLPTHPDIQALAAELEVNARVTSIYPRFDPNIPEGSRLDGATNIELDLVGHFRVLTDPAALRAVAHAVGLA